MNAPELGPIVFAYDGSDLAKAAIEEAARQLGTGREALVVTVWEPPGISFGAVAITPSVIDEITKDAGKTAGEGAELAEAAGFRATSSAIEATPTWKGVVDVADERGASIIVLGSHGRTGLAGVVIGSVAGAVAAHSHRSVLIVHRRA